MTAESWAQGSLLILAVLVPVIMAGFLIALGKWVLQMAKSARQKIDSEW